MVLPIEKVMYQAQEVAAVIATSRYIAADGVAAVEVEYEPLPVVVDPHQGARAGRAGAPHRPQTGQEEQPHLALGSRATRPRPTQAFAEAEVTRQAGHLHPAHPRRLDRDLRLRRRLRHGRGQAHGLDDHQAPHAIRTVFALVAGHSACEQKIRIISPDIGGGFGGKVPVYPAT